MKSAKYQYKSRDNTLASYVCFQNSPTPQFLSLEMQVLYIIKFPIIPID